MSYGFFLSYARDDVLGESYISKFFEDLKRDLHGRDRLGAEHGFMDTTLAPGAVWSASLGRALMTSRTMVCLLSPSYATSEFCGKEFSVFNGRVQQYIDDAKPKEPPPLIVQVLWGAPDTKFPEVISRLQYKGAGKYQVEGLRYLMTLKDNHTEYAELVHQLGGFIHRAASTYPLPAFVPPDPTDPLSGLPRLEDVKSAFHAPAVVEATRKVPGGPARVNFIYVAGKPNEMKAVRQTVDHYEPAGGPTWKPYGEGYAKIIAQNALVGQNVFYEEAPFGPDLRARLEEIEKHNELVVLLVDPWTAGLKGYGDVLSGFDKVNFGNCTALIPWNNGDPELTTKSQTLFETIRAVFKFKSASRGPYFTDQIKSEAALRKRITKVIAELQGKSTSSGAARPARSQRLARRASARGSQVASPAVVSGPGAPSA